MLKGPNLVKFGYAMVEDFFDADGRIVEAEAAVDRGLPVLCIFEWRLVTRVLKEKYRYGIISGKCPMRIRKKDGLDTPLLLNNDHLYDITGQNGKTIRTWYYMELDLPLNNYCLNAGNTLMIPKKLWCDLFDEVRALTPNIRKRTELLRLHHGTIYTGHDLNRFGYKNSGKCDYCAAEKQTFTHLLRECPRVKQFRKTVEEKLHIKGADDRTIVSG